MLVAAKDAWPDAPFLSERLGEGWQTVSYESFADRVALAASRIGSGERVAIVARNSIATAIATFAVMAQGGTVIPLSPGYLLHPNGVDTIRKLIADCEPTRLLADHDLLAPLSPIAGIEIADIAGLTGNRPIDLRAAAAGIAPSTLAKILFTSGSTGKPKAVPNTHAMLCAAIQMAEDVRPRLLDRSSSERVDWLPWHHTFGGNVNFLATLLSGSHFYIDDGLPTPAGFARMMSNLALVGPHSLTTVPAALIAMIDAMERNGPLAAAVLRNVHVVLFGGAPLDAHVGARFQTLAVHTLGRRIMFGSGYGMTETAGVISHVHWPSERADLMGAPLPGVELKFVPYDEDRFECRVRGANVFSGYSRRDNADTFDEEGYFRTGDAVRPVDPEDWSAGVVLDGRIAEDFKLANGTWVRAGTLRARIRAALGPFVRDVLLVGAGQADVGLLMVPMVADIVDQPVQEAIRRFNAEQGGGVTTRIGRAAWLSSKPDPARGEINEKGELNPVRATRERAEEIRALYASEPTIL
jgi:feruloyl-CoA synthase